MLMSNNKRNQEYVYIIFKLTSRIYVMMELMLMYIFNKKYIFIKYEKIKRVIILLRLR